jgi:hypothetical protein
MMRASTHVKPNSGICAEEFRELTHNAETQAHSLSHETFGFWRTRGVRPYKTGDQILAMSVKRL